MGNDLPDWRTAWRTLFGTPAPSAPHGLDPSTLKAAFRRRARETHPDRTGRFAHDDTRAFREVAAAYEVLRCFAGGSSRRAPVPDGPVRVVRSPAVQPEVPHRKMALGQLLVHLGWVSWDAALDAVRWQASNRCPIGRVAVRQGRLRDRDVHEILRRRRAGERFGDCAARLGLLTRTALDAILHSQRRLVPPIGQYFVQQGLLTPARLHEALERQRQHNLRVTSLGRHAA